MSSKKNGAGPQLLLTSSAIFLGELFFVLTSSRSGVILALTPGVKYLNAPFSAPFNLKTGT